MAGDDAMICAMRQVSEFARRLKAHRVRFGTHGRMTQDRLAELLGVSVDAIGKYERSLSYIRGDLEHRLIDKLGWSRDDVIACRRDWEARRSDSDTSYRLMDDAVVDKLFGGSWRDASRAAVLMTVADFGYLPAELAPNLDVFVPLYETHRENWKAVVKGKEIVAKWALPFLLPEDEASFRAGTLLESELSADRLHVPLLPGTYYGYCPALIVRRGHQAASLLLLDSFLAFLESLLERDVFLRGLGTVSVSDSGAQLCRDLGMKNLGKHSLSPAYDVWEMTGDAIPGSVFGQRSKLVQNAYQARFGAGAEDL